MMLHPIISADPEAPIMFGWITTDGDPILIGEHDAVCALHVAIQKYLDSDMQGAPIYDTDPAWGNSYDIADAVAEATEFGCPVAADTIRSACRGGRIRGATQSDTGRWLMPRRTFRYWLQNYRPKPRR